MEEEKPSIVATYEQNDNTGRWEVTAIFGKCSITCAGYKTKDEAVLAFRRLKSSLKL